MTMKYFALLTNQGAALLANAAALGTKINITAMAVGDGGGTLPTPDPAQTKLVGEKRRAQLNALSIDAANSSQIIAEQVIPEGEGGFWIREIGLFDADGVLIAVANCAETYKPQLAEGSGRTQTVRMIIIVSSTSAVTLKIDPAVVLATRKYVDDAVIEVKAYADSLMTAHLKAADPHTQYAPKESPALTGKPTAPTPAQTVNNTQLATTAFVKSAIAALVASSPAALDTLKELADALGNDPNFATTMTNALANKQPLDATLTSLSGKSVAALIDYLGLGTAAKKNVGTGVNQIPDMSTFQTGSTSAGVWVKFPNGFLIQRGVLANTSKDAGIDVTFPTPFLNTPAISLAATAAVSVNTNFTGGSNTKILAVRTFTSDGSPGQNGVSWSAMGF